MERTPGKRLSRKEIIEKCRAEAPKYFYKYRAVNDDNMSALEQRKIWLASVPSLNDPHDGNLTVTIDLAIKWHDRVMPFIVRDEFGEILGIPISFDGAVTAPPDELRRIYEGRAANLRKDVDRLGVYSLCSDPCVSQMWAHYGGGHTGFCIEYPYVQEVFDPDVGTRPAVKMNYVDKYPRLDLGVLIREPLELVTWKLLAHKSIEYQYEKEYRMLEKCSNRLIDVPTPISGIVFGVRSEVAIRDRIVRMFQDVPNFRFMEVRKVANSYAYEIVQLNDLEAAANP